MGPALRRDAPSHCNHKGFARTLCKVKGLRDLGILISGGRFRGNRFPQTERNHATTWPESTATERSKTATELEGTATGAIASVADCTRSVADHTRSVGEYTRTVADYMRRFHLFLILSHSRGSFLIPTNFNAI